MISLSAPHVTTADPAASKVRETASEEFSRAEGRRRFAVQSRTTRPVSEAGSKTMPFLEALRLLLSLRPLCPVACCGVGRAKDVAWLMQIETCLRLSNASAVTLVTIHRTNSATEACLLGDPVLARRPQHPSSTAAIGENFLPVTEFPNGPLVVLSGMTEDDAQG